MLSELLTRIWSSWDFVELLKLSFVLATGYVAGRLTVDTLQYALKNVHGFFYRKRLDKMTNKLLVAQKEVDLALKGAVQHEYNGLDIEQWHCNDTNIQNDNVINPWMMM